jgi:hypothetical protein
MSIFFPVDFQRSFDQAAAHRANFVYPATFFDARIRSLYCEEYSPGLIHYGIKMTDRRRINGPSGGTSAPVFSKYLIKDSKDLNRPTRSRAPNVLRKMCMFKDHINIAFLIFRSSEDWSHSFSIRVRIP